MAIVSWGEGERLLDASASGQAAWSSQAFSGDLFESLKQEHLNAVWHSSGQRKIARWLRTFGRSVEEGMDLLVDGRIVEFHRQHALEISNKIVPFGRHAAAYILSNCSVDECLVLPAKSRPLWARRFGWYEFPFESAKRCKIEIKIRPLLPEAV